MIKVPTTVMDEYKYYNDRDLLIGGNLSKTQIVLHLIDAYMGEDIGDYSMDWMEDNMLDLVNAIRCEDDVSFGVPHYYLVHKGLLVLGNQGWVLDKRDGIKFTLEDAVDGLKTNIKATGIEKVE